MLSRVAHVRIDEQRARAGLRKHGREIGCEYAAAFAALGADDRERGMRRLRLRLQEKPAADAAQSLDHGAAGVVGGDDLVADPQGVAARDDGIVVLASQGELDVLLREEFEVQPGFAEAHLVGRGESTDLVYIGYGETSCRDQNRANRPADAARRSGSGERRILPRVGQRILNGHRTTPWRPCPGAARPGARRCRRHCARADPGFPGSMPRGRRVGRQRRLPAPY